MFGQGTRQRESDVVMDPHTKLISPKQKEDPYEPGANLSP